MQGVVKIMEDNPAIRRKAWFTQDKFRPATLPANTVRRPVLHERLRAGAGQRLTAVVGPAGSGKSVLLSSWAADRPPGATAWLTCGQADANPVRFWTAFIEAPRVIAPWFGADAADLLATDRTMSADVIASIANDAAKLPPGSAVIVDDFHAVSATTAEDMSELVEQWPSETTQLILAGRTDPQVRLHRLRLAGGLCELGAEDLRFSQAGSSELLHGFGAELSEGQLTLLHQRTEGWAAALKMAALALRGPGTSPGVARTLAGLSNAISGYFVAEVLDQQPQEVAQFMLDTSILAQLTADSCAALTGRPDAARLLRSLDADHLFLVALDNARTRFRYHHLVHEVLRTELRARDSLREQELQLRAAEWLESAGHTQSAIRSYFAARRADRAIDLMGQRVLPGYFADPVVPRPLDRSMINPSMLTDAPDQLLAVAAHLLLSGKTSTGGQYLDLLERAEATMPSQSRLRARFMTLRALHYTLIGDADGAVRASMAARSIQNHTQQVDEWNVAVPMTLLTAYTWLEDFEAVEVEAATALASPSVSEPVKLVAVPGARALASFESGRLNLAGDLARAAEVEARRLGFSRHFFAVGYLRTLAGLALERRDLDRAEQLTERALTIAEHRRPAMEFLLLLDRAQIAAARGEFVHALATADAARRVLAGSNLALFTRADELEAVIRQSVGDLSTAADLAARLPRASRQLMLAKIALTAGAHDTAAEHLRSLPLVGLTPRRTLIHHLLVAATAIQRADPAATGIIGGILKTARDDGYLNSVITAAPQVTSYLIEYLSRMRPDPYIRQLSEAAIAVRDSRRGAGATQARDGLIEPLTEAELHVLRLLPTSSYQQIAATLYVSPNTVKTHLRSIYRKLGVASRSDAIARALERCLI